MSPPSAEASARNQARSTCCSNASQLGSPCVPGAHRRDGKPCWSRLARAGSSQSLRRGERAPSRCGECTAGKCLSRRTVSSARSTSTDYSPGWNREHDPNENSGPAPGFRAFTFAQPDRRHDRDDESDVHCQPTGKHGLGDRQFRREFPRAREDAVTIDSNLRPERREHKSAQAQEQDGVRCVPPLCERKEADQGD